MVSLLLVGMPLSKGYDFLGEPSHSVRGEVEEATPEEPPVVENDVPLQEETESEPEEPIAPEVVEEEKEEAPVSYIELDYKYVVDNNGMDCFPFIESGNYVVVYRSTNCHYCDMLLKELKGNLENYTLVVIKCSGTVRDLFYSRWINQYPSYLVIKGRKVRYYGYGYRSFEEFKRLL